jgi:hypothetical protein
MHRAVAQFVGDCATSRKVAGSIPMVSLEFFSDLGHIGALGVNSTSNRYEYRTVSWKKGRVQDGRCVGLTNLTTFICRFLRNLGASAFWNPQGLPRPVQGLLYLYLFWCITENVTFDFGKTIKILMWNNDEKNAAATEIQKRWTKRNEFWRKAILSAPNKNPKVSVAILHLWPLSTMPCSKSPVLGNHACQRISLFGSTYIRE